MQIKIPRFMSRVSTAFGDWVNVPIWRWRRRQTYWNSATYRELRRIDVLIVLGGIICTSYYFVTGGWLLALQGAGIYVFVVMIALWIL
jgi:hypothetical protein